MATKKSAATTKKKSTQKKPATTSTVTTVKTVSAKDKKVTQTQHNFPGIIVAEIVGTFVLTLVALLALQTMAPLYVGLTLMVLVIAIGGISGAHVNPAVTFGLWAARKLDSILLPVYWIAQFVGAILAVLVLNAVSNGGYGLDFSGFGSFNLSIAVIEMVGAAVFLFGVVAVVSQKTLGVAAKSLGIGASLTIGVLVSTALFTSLQGSIDTTNVDVSDRATVPHEYLVKGATLNPAIAVAATENSLAELTGSTAPTDEARVSRISLEVIVGTLVGAALGGNLYLLIAAGRRQ